MELPQLVASVLYYVCVVGVCEFGRRLSDRLAPGHLWLYDEFWATLQRCMITLEGFAIFRAYGFFPFLAVVAITLYLTEKTIRTGSGNPTPFFEKRFVDKSISSGQFYAIIVAEVVAAALAFQGARLFWSRGFTIFHEERFLVTVCSTDLHVSWLYGLAYEFLATFVCQIVCLQLPKHFSGETSLIIICVVVAVIVGIGMETTGMYFNPILASCLTFGCEGLSNLGHLFVYWLGPILGWISGTFLHKMITGGQRPKAD